MRRWVGLAGAMLGIVSAQAAEPPTNAVAAQPTEPLIFELTPFVGFDLGGKFRLGDAGAGGTGTTVDLADHAALALAFDLRLDEETSYELFYSRESSDLQGNAPAPLSKLTVEYLHIGGMAPLDEDALLKSYMVGGLGVTRFSPGQQGSSDTRFSASVGIGVRWPVTRRFSIRLEARGFATLVNPDAAVFCRSDQTGLLCRVHGQGKTFIQGQLVAGAAFAF